MYRVIYLDHARRTWVPGSLTKPQAEAQVRWFKRRGYTAWVVDDQGTFVPIPGARKQPTWIE